MYWTFFWRGTLQNDEEHIAVGERRERGVRRGRHDALHRDEDRQHGPGQQVAGGFRFDLCYFFTQTLRLCSFAVVGVGIKLSIDVKNVFLRFLFRARFLLFLTFFYFANVFYF